MNLPNQLGPTVELAHDLQAEPLRRRNADVSMPRMGFVQGTRPRFSHETADLLRSRLRAATLVLSLVLAYYLVTGRPPFASDSVWDIIAAHGRDPVKPPADVNPAVPPDFELVIIRCLAKLPGNRFQDVESLEKALAGCECAGKWTEDQAAAWWRDHGG